jgi:type IV pilus assembly protein PilM
MWSDEFNRYIRYYNSNNKDLQIKKIYVYGTYSKITGLEQYFEKNLNLKTEIIYELSNVVIKTDSKSDTFDIRSYMNAVLSVYINKNDINFLSDKKKKHSSNFNTGVVLMTIGAVVILTVAYYGYSYYVEKTSLERDIAAIDKYITDTENIKLNNEAIQIKNRAMLLQTYMEEIDKLTTSIKNEDAVNSIIFEQVSAAMPVGTKVNSMSVDKTSLQLQCSSATRQEVAQFEKNLKAIEFIDNVYVPAVVDIAEGGNNTYSYSVVCEIKDVIAYEAE